ncbi:MAG: hypothetical protein COV02_00770 [Candidatus Terrybacteria bacterium CG10_big_fil_rev_8_21_14_0_10_41_10]|uniref:Uncharacterized protein n=1 Tax=Candidatus Terrybacteria bacterium CG10_big_fil_rev_8_21_14_0_10_41_10 TaxID=1975026 RepID=A0A2M8LB10_9BACT|nr:MAG: hypothetical protein COV02_00770 [Candidatus Terrybacteria bacterium CG10_big_fil_rev_8_21_14_0_10_41_10]
MAKNIATIEIPKSALSKGVVILGLSAYKKLQEKAVPAYYFSGKKAEEIDKLVKEGLDEHKKGKTIRLKSLADLR